ncbi:MAG: hypothetical protein N2Z74_09265 [Syntrophales bacterium]|nr:hypothetical protein [Syntrophales bacterium]
MTENDPITTFLQQRGCPPHVIREGMAGLVRRWEGIVQSVAAGYQFGLHDYLNDMDLRQIIAEALPLMSEVEREDILKRVGEADDLLKQYVRSVPMCLWGEETAQEEGWSERRNWWYYSLPRTLSEEMRQDLGEYKDFD